MYKKIILKITAHRTDLIKLVLSSVYKRLQIQEFSKNEDFIGVLLPTFRNVLEKFQNLDLVKIINFFNQRIN